MNEKEAKELINNIEYHKKEANKAYNELLFEKGNYHVGMYLIYKQVLKEEPK